MSNSTRSGWAAPGGAFWSGTWQQRPAELEVTDPENGNVVGAVVDATPGDIEEAVRSVHDEVMTGPGWPVWQRREALSRASDLIREREQMFVELISAEGCKPLRDAGREVARAAETVRLASEQTALLQGRTLPFGDTPRGNGRVGWFTREPVGVVAAITPFNDPLNLVAHKLAPALVAGNGVVLKPAEHTPLTALAFAEVLLDAGVPAARLAVVTGRGSVIGETLVSHPLVDLVSFTGGWSTGNAVARSAGAKKTLMELGGNGAVLVLDDSDVPSAARAIVDGAFGNAGQNCLSVQRVYAAAPVYETLLDQVIALTRDLVVGSKTEDGTDVGPLIDEEAALRVESWVREAVDEGAVIHVGGKREGNFYWPTVLSGTKESSKAIAEEVFGPVVSIAEFSDLDSAVSRINSSEYGLQAGVFTRDIDRALDVAESLRVGGVMINDTGDFRIDAMPFGGGKRSGVGREGVPFAVEAMTEPKIVAINRSA